MLLRAVFSPLVYCLAQLLACSLMCCMCLSRRACVVILLSDRHSSNFSLILTKLNTHLCANMLKTVEQSFEILILKFLDMFFKVLHLDLFS